MKESKKYHYYTWLVTTLLNNKELTLEQLNRRWMNEEVAEYVIAKCSLPVQEQEITPPTPHADMQKREKPIQFSMEDRMVEGELF